jgi:hypothetical protein
MAKKWELEWGLAAAHTIVPGDAGVNEESNHATAVGVNVEDGHCVATTGRFLLERPPHLVVHSSAEQPSLLELIRHAFQSLCKRAACTMDDFIHGCLSTRKRTRACNTLRFPAKQEWRCLIEILHEKLFQIDSGPMFIHLYSQNQT